MKFSIIVSGSAVLVGLASTVQAAPIVIDQQDILEREPFIGALVRPLVGGISSMFGGRKRDFEEDSLQEREFENDVVLLEREPFIGALLRPIASGVSSLFGGRKRDFEEDSLQQREFEDDLELLEREPFIGALLRPIASGVSSLFGGRKREIEEALSMRSYDELLEMREHLEGILEDLD